MENTTRSAKQTYAAKRWRMTQEQLVKEQLAHKETKSALKEAQDIIATLTQENLEVGKMNKDLRNHFVNGGVVYTINNGYVSSAMHLPTCSEYTFDQPIPKEIGTPLYNKIPFVKVIDRQLTIDKTQYNKYKGAIL